MRLVKDALLLLFLLSAPAAARADIEESKKPCTAAQSADVSAAMKAAQVGLSKTITSIKSPNANDEQRFIVWFGVGTAIEKKAVLTTYETALTLASFSFVYCPLSSTPDLFWNLGDLAAVHPDAPGAIFVTPEFFKLPVTGQDSQQGTIVHELSHRSGATLNPEVYKPGPAKQLAQTNPADAAKNADNFEYYYENLIFGVP